MSERELRHELNAYIEKILKRQLTEKEQGGIRIYLKKIIKNKTENQARTIQNYEKIIASLKTQKPAQKQKPAVTGYWD